jgi:hypothetical protein
MEARTIFPNAAVDALAKNQVRPRLADLDAVAFNAIFAGAAVCDVEGARAGGRGADPARHTGGVEICADLVWAFRQVAWGCHRWLWLGWGAGRVLERQASGFTATGEAAELFVCGGAGLFDCATLWVNVIETAVAV